MGAHEFFEDGKRLFVEGKLKESIDAFTEALDTGGNPEIIYLSRGTAHLKLKETIEAIDDFTKAIESGKRNPRTYYYRGMAYTNKEDFGKAVADFSKAIELKPDYAQAFFARGASFIRMNKLEEAGQDIKNAVTYSEAAIQGYADFIGDRTYLDKILAVLEGERRTSALAINDAEFAMIRKWIEEKV